MRNRVFELMLSLLLAPLFGARCSAQEYPVDSTSHTYSIARLKTTCVDVPAFKSCKVEQFSRLGQVGDTIYYFAVYKGTPAADTEDYYRGVTVFESIGNVDSATSLFEWGARVYEMYVDKPEFVKSRYGTFLHVFVTSGNGGWEMGKYFLYRNGRWVRLHYPEFLDSSEWDRVVGTKIPKGYWLCRGNEINLKKMLITLPVFKRDDPCCCPTGGCITAFYMVLGDSLVIDSSSYSRAPCKYNHR